MYRRPGNCKKKIRVLLFNVKIFSRSTTPTKFFNGINCQVQCSGMRLHMSRNEQLVAFMACERIPRNTIDTYHGSKDGRL